MPSFLSRGARKISEVDPWQLLFQSRGSLIQHTWGYLYRSPLPQVPHHPHFWCRLRELHCTSSRGCLVHESATYWRDNFSAGEIQQHVPIAFCCPSPYKVVVYKLYLLCFVCRRVLRESCFSSDSGRYFYTFGLESAKLWTTHFYCNSRRPSILAFTQGTTSL